MLRRPTWRFSAALARSVTSEVSRICTDVCGCHSLADINNTSRIRSIYFFIRPAKRILQDIILGFKLAKLFLIRMVHIP